MSVSLKHQQGEDLHRSCPNLKKNEWDNIGKKSTEENQDDQNNINIDISQKHW